MKNDSKIEPTKKDEVFPLLDSRLITDTVFKRYDIKLVDCGDYTQVYLYQNTKTIKRQKDTSDLELKRFKINNILIEENKIIENKTNDLKENKIENRNIIRSKLSCQRIAKANSKIWNSFITLTFEENLTDIKRANEIFRRFISKIRKRKQDFAYIAIPEFQKRGSIHYHLLTNIKINDTSLIYSQIDNSKFKHIKYWNYGFTSVEIMTGDIKKIVGYISKYMTKDIDNRLFGHRRFLYSQNLFLPKDNFINSNIDKEYDFYLKKIQNKEQIYQSEYINPYDGTIVTYFEFTTNNNIVQ